VSIVCRTGTSDDLFTLQYTPVSPLPGVHDTVKSLIHISVAVMLLIGGGATKWNI